MAFFARSLEEEVNTNVELRIVKHAAPATCGLCGLLIHHALAPHKRTCEKKSPEDRAFYARYRMWPSKTGSSKKTRKLMSELKAKAEGSK